MEIFLRRLQAEDCGVKKKKKFRDALADNDEPHLTLQTRVLLRAFWSQFGSKSLTRPSADAKHQAVLVKTLLRVSSGTV